MKKQLLVPIALCGLFGASLQGSIVLAQYDFETWGPSPSRSFAANTVDTLLTGASNIAISSVGSNHGYTTYGDNSSVPFQSQGGSPLIDGYYWQNTTGTAAITLTPDQAISFETLSFGVGTSNSNGTTWEVTTTETTGTIDQGSITAIIGSEGDYQDISIDLTGFAGLQNQTAAVTFSIELSSTFGNSTPRLDKIEVTAVPEPSTYAAILGLMGLGFVIYRRRR